MGRPNFGSKIYLKEDLKTPSDSDLVEVSGCIAAAKSSLSYELLLIPS
jgi:hypothetical protein